MAPGDSAKSEAKPKVSGGAYKDREKPAQIRASNITAAKGNLRFVINSCYSHLSLEFSILAVADAIRTSLGPRGMDKMVMSDATRFITVRN